MIATPATVVALMATIAAFAVAPPVAQAVEDHRATERAGAAALESVLSGETSCRALSGERLEQIGELAMGRMIGSPDGHESMDAMIGRMMGESGLRAMHVAMGRRLAGCGGRMPAGAGGAMGMMGMLGAAGGLPGVTGGGDDPDEPGSMMGGEGAAPDDLARRGGVRDDRLWGPMWRGGGDRWNDDDEWSGAAIVMAALMGALVLLALGGAGYALVRARRPADAASAVEILALRLARGEIDAADYEQRRRALESGDG